MPVLQSIRSLTGNSILVYAWQSGAASSVIYQFGPESLGGTGDLKQRIDALDVKDEEARAKEVINVSISYPLPCHISLTLW